MTIEERAQLIEDIERSAGIRRDIAEQARLAKEFDLAAAWVELDELDASIAARIAALTPPAGPDVELSA